MKKPSFKNKIKNKTLIFVFGLFAFSATAQTNPDYFIRADFAEGDLTKECNSVASIYKPKFDELEKISGEDAKDFSKTVIAYENLVADLTDEAMPLLILYYFSPVEYIRNEAAACGGPISDATASITSNETFFQVLKNAQPRSAIEKRLQEFVLKDFGALTLNLSKEQNNRLSDLSGKLSKIQNAYMKALREETILTFTTTQLTGLTQEQLESLTKQGKSYKTVIPKNASLVLNNVQNSATRKKVLGALLNVGGKKNIKYLQEALKIRQEIATLLGKKSWNDHRIRDSMVGDTDRLNQFINTVKDPIIQSSRNLVATLLEFKKTVEPGATKINHWDFDYLITQYKKSTFKLNMDEIKRYFPAEHVIRTTFDIYEELLGLRFTEIKEEKIWSPDVQLYQVNDATTNSIIGYFYVDLFKRVGKYGGTASIPFISEKKLRGKHPYPIGSITALFEKPAEGKPLLFSHEGLGDIYGLFHEFGHVMSDILSHSPYTHLSTKKLVLDFVEAPSQMLENWIWDKDLIRKLSQDSRDPTKKIPDDLIDRMLAARNFDKQIYYARIFSRTLVDYRLHQEGGSNNPDKTFNKAFAEVYGIKAIKKNHYNASFHHLMGSKDGLYYSYLWANTFSADLFTRFKSEGFFNKDTGRDLRLLFEAGNEESPIDLVTKFLGRTPNSNAFFEELPAIKR